MAYAELVQVLDEKSLLLFITDAADDGRIALDILRKHFASTEKSRVLTLYAELKTITMMDHGDVTVYIIRAERATTGLQASGKTIPDTLVMAMVLKGLPESYKPIIVVHITQLEKVKTFSDFKAALSNTANTEALRTNNVLQSAPHKTISVKS